MPMARTDSADDIYSEGLECAHSSLVRAWEQDYLPFLVETPSSLERPSFARRTVVKKLKNSYSLLMEIRGGGRNFVQNKSTCAS